MPGLIQKTGKVIKKMFKGAKADKKKETEPSKIIAEYDALIDAASTRRAKYERNWFMNIAFLLGHQYIQWNDSTKQYEDPKVPSWRVQLAVNMVIEPYRQALNDIGGYNPRTVCTPNSQEMKDVEAAATGTKVLGSLNMSCKLRVVHHEKTQWQLTAGTGYIHFAWGSDKGDLLPAEKDEQGNEIPNSNGLRTGDVRVEAPSPFELYVIKGGATSDSVRAVAWVKPTSVDEVKMLHGAKANDLKPGKNSETIGLYKDKIERLVSTNDTYGSFATAEDDDEVLYVRIWECPSPNYPKGRYLCYANDILFDDKPTPDLYNSKGEYMGKEFEIPFLKYDDLTVPGRYFGQSKIEQAIPIQKERNKNRSQVIENKNMLGKPKVLTVKDSVDEYAFTDEPGEVIEWDPSAPGAVEPKYLTPPSLPSYVQWLDGLFKSDVDDIFGRHMFSRGQTEKGVTSGTAIDTLKAGDQAGMGSIFLMESENKKTLAGAMLKLVQEHYTEERMLKVVGESKQPEVFAFSGADLRGNTDVWIEEDDIMPTNRADRQKFIMALYDKGYFGDPANDITRKRGLRMLRFGMIDEIWDDSGEDTKMALNENKKMAEGYPQEVHEWDDHAVHMITVLKEMKSPMFIEKPLEIQEIFKAHLYGHLELDMPPAEDVAPDDVSAVAPSVGEGVV